MDIDTNGLSTNIKPEDWELERAAIQARATRVWRWLHVNQSFDFSREDPKVEMKTVLPASGDSFRDQRFGSV